MIFRFGFDSRRKSKAVRLARLREYKCSVPTRPPVSLSRGGKVPPGVPSSFLPLNHCVSPLSISLAVSPPSRVEWGDKSILSSLKVAYPCSCVLAETFFFPLSFSLDIHRLKTKGAVELSLGRVVYPFHPPFSNSLSLGWRANSAAVYTEYTGLARSTGLWSELSTYNRVNRPSRRGGRGEDDEAVVSVGRGGLVSARMKRRGERERRDMICTHISWLRTDTEFALAHCSDPPGFNSLLYREGGLS